MTCKLVGKFVRRIITLGTPNMGIDGITIGSSNQYMEDLEQDPTVSKMEKLKNQPKLA